MSSRVRYAVLVPAIALPVLMVTACGTATVPAAGVRPSAESSADTSGGGSAGSAGPDDGQVYTGTGTVLESPDHGPQLCLGAVDASLPPQCGGPDIVGWSWDDVDGAESANGTTWGSYTVVGTYEGPTFTLTEPATAPVAGEEPDTGYDFATPCDAPDGGWDVVDAATATDGAMQVALGVAAGSSGYAGAWVDEPNADNGFNDPTKLILNVTTTGDVEALESRLRDVWGGALCVSAAPRAEAELLTILDAVMKEPGALSGSPDVTTGTVQLQVFLDEGVQERMDDTYGEGVVIVDSALRPVD